MVASGVFNNLVEIKGNDEVGQLSQDLEVMAGKLQNLIAAVKNCGKAEIGNAAPAKGYPV